MPLEAADIQNIAQALKALAPAAPQQQQQQGVQAVSLKLPEFWTDKPEVGIAFSAMLGVVASRGVDLRNRWQL